MDRVATISRSPAQQDRCQREAGVAVWLTDQKKVERDAQAIVNRKKDIRKGLPAGSDAVKPPTEGECEVSQEYLEEKHGEYDAKHAPSQ